MSEETAVIELKDPNGTVINTILAVKKEALDLVKGRTTALETQACGGDPISAQVIARVAILEAYIADNDSLVWENLTIETLEAPPGTFTRFISDSLIAGAYRVTLDDTYGNCFQVILTCSATTGQLRIPLADSRDFYLLQNGDIIIFADDIEIVNKIYTVTKIERNIGA